MTTPHILVVTAAGLGPFVQAIAALAAIRGHHVADHITLLASPETAEFARGAGYADEVRYETVPPWWQFRLRREMAARFRAQNFTRIYDLDSGDLGRSLFQLLFGRVRDRAAIPWNGDIPGTALSGAAVASKALHVRDRLTAQLNAAGITEVLPPDLTWVARRVTGFHLPLRMTDPFVLLAVDPAVSGDTWPGARFAALAETVVAQGLVPVLVGLRLAPDVAAAVAENCPTAVNLTGRGEINDLVFLAWAARGAVGCDNGLMHLFALAGCRAVVLHDAGSDPALTGQRGHDVIILRRPRLADIPVGEVVAALKQKRYVEQGRFT